MPVKGYTKEGDSTSYTIYKDTEKARTVTLYNSFTKVFKRGEAELQEDKTYKMTGTTLSEYYTEPYTSGYPNERDEYYAMMESVQEYGEFYIARYEAGDSTAPEGGRTSSSVVSTLCYGVQWDATMNFVSGASHNIWNSTNWGNYYNNSEDGHGSLQTTGSNDNWKAKNIYDLAGNVGEWTMEACFPFDRIFRGDYFDDGSTILSAFHRVSNVPDNSNGAFGFRPALYIVVE